MEVLRGLIADDHPLFHHRIREFLNLAPDIQVVGEAMGGEEAITYAGALHSDMILMDVNMPSSMAPKRRAEFGTSRRTFAFLWLQCSRMMARFLLPCARGCIFKDTEKENILSTIQVVGNGEAIFISPSIAMA